MSYVLVNSCQSVLLHALSQLYNPNGKTVILSVQENNFFLVSSYRSADKSLARSGRKQANVSVRMT